MWACVGADRTDFNTQLHKLLRLVALRLPQQYYSGTQLVFIMHAVIALVFKWSRYSRQPDFSMPLWRCRNYISAVNILADAQQLRAPCCSDITQKSVANIVTHYVHKKKLISTFLARFSLMFGTVPHQWCAAHSRARCERSSDTHHQAHSDRCD